MNDTDGNNLCLLFISLLHHIAQRYVIFAKAEIQARLNDCFTWISGQAGNDEYVELDG